MTIIKKFWKKLDDNYLLIPYLIGVILYVINAFNYDYQFSGLSTGRILFHRVFSIFCLLILLIKVVEKYIKKRQR